MNLEESSKDAINKTKEIFLNKKLPTYLKIAVAVVIGVVFSIVILVSMLVVIAAAEEEEVSSDSGSSVVGGTESANSLEWFMQYINSMEGGEVFTNDGIECYKVLDIGDGATTVGHGVTIEGCATEFAEAAKELGINDNISNYHVGDFVRRDWVDKTEELKFKKIIENIKSVHPGLEVYQYYALASQAYAKGLWGAEFNSYYTWDSWNQDEDLEYGNCSFKYKDNSMDDLLNPDSHWEDGYFGGFAQGFLRKWDFTNRYPGLRKRRRADYIMFKSGWSMVTHTYCPLGNSNGVNSNGEADIIEKAEEIHTYIEQHGYTYGHGYSESPDGMRNIRTINCCSYVTWVYREAGYIDKIYNTSAIFKDTLDTIYKDKFEQVSFNELQPGDIMFYKTTKKSIGHVQIYAGDHKIYNTGSDKAIHRDNPYAPGDSTLKKGFVIGYRLKSTENASDL